MTAVRSYVAPSPTPPIPTATPSVVVPAQPAGSAFGSVDFRSPVAPGVASSPIAVPQPTATRYITPPTVPPVAPPVAPPSSDVASAEQYTIDLINAHRAASGISPIARDETLMYIARSRVADMVARGYTGHYDPITGASLGANLVRGAGYSRSSENWYGSAKAPPTLVEIAMGFFVTDPPHAHPIFSPDYTVVGVGIAYNGRMWLLVQNFAAP